MQPYLVNNVVEIFHSKYYLVFVVTADNVVAKILLNMLKCTLWVCVTSQHFSFSMLKC